MTKDQKNGWIGLLNTVADYFVKFPIVQLYKSLPISQIQSLANAYEKTPLEKYKTDLLAFLKTKIPVESISGEDGKFVLEALKTTLSYITAQNLLHNRDNHNALVEEIVKKSGFDIDGRDMGDSAVASYIGYVKKIVEAFYDSFAELEIATEVEVYLMEQDEAQTRALGALLLQIQDFSGNFLHMEKTIEDIKATGDDTNQTVHDLNEKIDTVLRFPKENQETESFHDDSQFYVNQFYQPLFNETDDMVDLMQRTEGKEAALADVFVTPKAIQNYSAYNVNAIIDTWLTLNSTPLLVVYGKPGIGKSSLASYLAAVSSGRKELQEKDGLQSLIGRCLFLRLRDEKNRNRINDKEPWSSVKQCFGEMRDSFYQDKILILDGLDEVCVLKQFDGAAFLNGLHQHLKSLGKNGYKVLILTREGYFEKPKMTASYTIFWSDEEVTEWCHNYIAVHPEKETWLKQFLPYFTSLGQSDGRRELFCTPLILYLCCRKNKIPQDTSSICEIYEDIFEVSVSRQYSYDELLNNTDKRRKIIGKQLTKELAYQLFLQNKLDIFAADDQAREYAESRTLELLKQNQAIKDFNHLDEEYQNYVKREYCISYFVSGRESGVEFAHKTIAEYFTAVKLYEDYFAKIDANSSVEETWEMIYQAFRFHKIPSDIMSYLTELTKKQGEDWRERFFEQYYTGMESEQLWKQINAAVPKEYKDAATKPLSHHVAIAFRNLTWLLTGLGFRNEQADNDTKIKDVFSSYIQRGISLDINCISWKNLTGVNLNKADLPGAYLTGAHLTVADLNEAVLTGAHLNGADLTGAHLNGAHLKRADLTRAHLNGAHLNGADLAWAHLIGAYLNEAALTDANLDWADLTGAHLRQAIYDQKQLQSAHKVYKAILK